YATLHFYNDLPGRWSSGLFNPLIIPSPKEQAVCTIDKGNLVPRREVYNTAVNSAIIRTTIKRETIDNE
ncbi:MAG: hypothetical protein M0Q12_11545, partial [Synergistaceae bacterium]|nr:hypothetical protein [Synergistaceae bacterium]